MKRYPIILEDSYIGPYLNKWRKKLRRKRWVSLYQIGDKYGIMSDKFNILTDTEQAVLQTMTMQMSPMKALEYLKVVGVDISKRTYFGCKKKVESTKWQRLYRIAELLTDQHLQRIVRLELIESLMWKNYDGEKNPHKKVDILASIVNMQPYLSNYYGATRFVLERRLKINPIKKAPVYMDIDIDKKQAEENKFYSQRDYLNK
jgi:hypothetical protein